MSKAVKYVLLKSMIFFNLKLLTHTHIHKNQLFINFALKKNLMNLLKNVLSNLIKIILRHV